MRKIKFLAMALFMLLFASTLFAQAPAVGPIQPKKATPDFATLGTGLPIQLNGDTLYRIRGNQWDAAVGIDLASWKNLITLRAELSQSVEGNPFSGVGLFVNIPTLVNKIAGSRWEAGAINPSVGVVPGVAWGNGFDVAVVLSIISVTF